MYFFYELSANLSFIIFYSFTKENITVYSPVPDSKKYDLTAPENARSGLYLQIRNEIILINNRYDFILPLNMQDIEPVVILLWRMAPPHSAC